MANTYLSVVTMEIINQYSVMLPLDNVGARTSTAMSYMVQGSQVYLQTALILVSSPSLCIDLKLYISLPDFIGLPCLTD